MTISSPPPARPRQRRPRARTILPLALAAWVVLEIWLLTVVARVTGGPAVLLLIVAGFVLGAAAVKRAGRSAWQSLAEAAQPGTERPRGQGTTNGAALAMLGGLLLMVPGLISDLAGLLCLFPPTRALLRKAAAGALNRRRSYEPGSLGDLLQQARTADEQIRIHRPDGKVVQGEVIHPEREDPGPRR
jgi:UPF0716 protein FxsA